jgi:hypothetical protein
MTRHPTDTGTRSARRAGKVTLARPCSVPGEIKAVEHNPAVKCQHCEDTRQHLTTDCFLAPLSAAATADNSAGALAFVAGLIAAVKLARVESREIQSRSPRVRSAVSEAITIGRRGDRSEQTAEMI